MIKELPINLKEGEEMITNQNRNSDEKPIQRLLKPLEVAEQLSISKSFVYAMIQTGHLPVVRMGKACRVRPQDLEAFIERNLQHSIELD